MAETYTDLEVRIRAADGDAEGHVVALRLDNAPIDEGELRLDKEKLSVAAQTLDRLAYGKHLFEAIFGGHLRDEYFQALARAAAQTGGRMRVRLLIAAADLHHYPWERLYYEREGRFGSVAASASTPFSRQKDGLPPLPDREPAVAPLRMLVAISNPKGLSENDAIDVEKEIQSLIDALGDLPELGLVHVTFLAGRSTSDPAIASNLDRWEKPGIRFVRSEVTGLQTIVKLLTTGPGFHVLHFLGHGALLEATATEPAWTELLLESEEPGNEGAKHYVSDAKIVEELDQMDPSARPRLVFLAACESARPSEEGSFTGLAPMLTEAGVGAVVAMRERVGMNAARQLTGAFYLRLLEHGQVDRALNEARGELFDLEGAAWSIPALYLRPPSKQSRPLFEPNRIRNAQQCILEEMRKELEHIPRPMPLEVVHLRGAQDLTHVEELNRGGGTSIKMLDAIPQIFRQEGRWIVLTGGRGSARTSHLYHLMRAAIEEQIRPPIPQADRMFGDEPEERPSGTPVIPVYVDLGTRYPPEHVTTPNPIESLLMQNLQKVWPGLTATTIDGLERSVESAFKLWVLVDDSDNLPLRQSKKAWQDLGNLVRENPQHAFLVTVGLENYVFGLLREATDTLVLQPLTQRALKTFLTPEQVPKGQEVIQEVFTKLYRSLNQNQLFDLASTPWLLARMIQRAQRGAPPPTRVGLLDDLIADAIDQMDISPTARPRAVHTLNALAYRMKQDRVTVLDAEVAFRTMVAVRGDREYDLEKLTDELADAGILQRVGSRIRFTYTAYENYCCARAILALPRPEQERALENISVSLGRLSRLRVWEETLVLLSAMMDDPNPLLEQLLYGASPSDCERIHIAGRCLAAAEKAPAGRATQVPIKGYLRDRIVDALVWRLSSDHVRDSALRARAARALGELGERSALRHLARVACEPVRIGQKLELAYEYSDVRMAAVLALKRLDFCPADGKCEPQSHDAEVQKEYPQLAELMRKWDESDIQTPIRLLAAEDESIGPLAAEDESIRPLAAFALVGICLEDDKQAPECLDALIKALKSAKTPSATRWAVADALTLLDPIEVTERVPELAQEEALHGQLAYLLGRIRATDPKARDFLHKCLQQDTRPRVVAMAIQALGMIYDRNAREQLEKIAVADFAGLAVKTTIDNYKQEDEAKKVSDREYLQRKALQSLAYVGTQETLDKLADPRKRWSSELRWAFYEAAEEIRWRQGAEQERLTSSGAARRAPTIVR